MNSNPSQAPERLSKASKHAHQLRSSLEKLLYLLPEAHETWRDLAHEARHIERRLEAILAIFEEMLERDPASFAALLLTSEEADEDTFSTSELQPKAARNGVGSRRFYSSETLET